MDDRKRQINEAEQRKKEQAALLDALLARIGEAVFERAGVSLDAPAFGELAAYRRFRNDIADSQDSIQAAEEQMRRFKELEEGIETREKEAALCAKDLAGAHGRLGKLLLEESGRHGSGSAYDDFCGPYRGQADELLSKVQSLEERLAGLEQKEKGNVFAWIGKSAQSLVLRSFLGKAQESLEQLRRTVGERFSGRGSGSLFPETAAVDSLCGEIELKQAEMSALAADTANLKDEKRKISESFSAEGGPVRYIQTLKNHIAHVQNELRLLYRGVGAEAALSDVPALDAEADADASAAAGTKGRAGTRGRAKAKAAPETGRPGIIASLLLPEDRENLEAARRMNRSILDCGIVIEKLKASIAVDDEKAKIEKYRRMIQEKREKIAQAERAILELEGFVRDSEAAIEKLRQLL